ncbi:MAG: hypothetical protein M1393_05970 [Candidatus Thermoplasmatota archaeon]|nr:hypothetical protein [Candidatus Thermoplasmatota archaeon]MDA8144323.1 hypothetical protein [Thermoplasmatales archaeon]
MDYTDIDKSLDKRFVISYPGSPAIAQFSKRNKLSFQSGLHLGDQTLELAYFIPASLKDNRDISIFLSQSEAKKQGNIYFINSSTQDPFMYATIKSQLRNMKSLMLDNILLSEGRYCISCRFHHSETEKVSRAILEYATKIEGLEIEYFGKSPGIRKILEEINETIRLRSFEWSVRIPEEEMESEILAALGKEWVGSNRFMTSDTHVNRLVKTQFPVKNPEKLHMTTISETDNIYEMETVRSFAFLDFYFRRAYELRVLRLVRDLHFKNGYLYTKVTIPEILSENFMEAITETFEHYPEWEPVLTHVSDFQ